MATKCEMCPFARTGPGAHLRRTLRAGRFESILHDLCEGYYFTCHKTTRQTGNGSNLVCAGAIEWQDRKGFSCAYVRLCQNFDAEGWADGHRWNRIRARRRMVDFG